jgi:hypothetical protein
MRKKLSPSRDIREQLEAHKKQLEAELLEVNDILDFIDKQPDAGLFIERVRKMFNN